MSIADAWNKPQVAKAVLDNSIPKIWRNGFYVAKLQNGELIKCSRTKEEMLEFKEEITSSNPSKNGYKLDLYSFDNDLDMQDLIRGFEDVQIVLEKTVDLRSKLEKEIVTLEYVLEDLKHYRLRKKLGTVNSYKFKNLGDKAVAKRMSLKNQLEILHKINQYREAITNPIKDICGVISAVKNKKYTPRIALDLFENDNLDINLENILNIGGNTNV